jgi:hypothetical protein
MRFLATRDGKLVQAIPTPEGAQNITGLCFFDGDGSSYNGVTATAKKLFPTDGTDIISDYHQTVADELGYSYFKFNPLMTASDVALLSQDPASIPYSGSNTLVSPRFQTGRAVAPMGLAPNSVALLSVNPNTNAPGAIVTDVIDISADYPTGTSSFLFHWKTVRFLTTPDVIQYGGSNEPITESVVDLDSSGTYDGESVTIPPTSFKVALLAEDGSWVSWLDKGVQCEVCSPITKFRLGFFNWIGRKAHLISYSVFY